MNRLLRTSIAAKLTQIGVKQLIRVFVFSTRFGKQTRSKRTIRAVWNASRH